MKVLDYFSLHDGQLWCFVFRSLSFVCFCSLVMSIYHLLLVYATFELWFVKNVEIIIVFFKFHYVHFAIFCIVCFVVDFGEGVLGFIIACQIYLIVIASFVCSFVVQVCFGWLVCFCFYFVYFVCLSIFCT